MTTKGEKVQGKTKELPIPAPAAADDRAVELARVWAAAGKQHVSLATEMWDDPAAWGILLVDLMKHVANGYVQTKGLERGEVIDRIKAGFDAEWSSETDEPEGGLV